jgi:hypothetical protein
MESGMMSPVGRKFSLLWAFAGLAVAASAMPQSAEARGRVFFSVGVPLYLGAPYYYPPPPPVYYYPPPPPVQYYPPPAAYAPAPAPAPTAAQICREYQSSVTIDGRPQPTYGTACQQADGTWRIVR